MSKTVVQLALLIAVTGAAYALTLALARQERVDNRDDAAAWHRRGLEALRRERPADAVAAFRRATTLVRGDRAYTLALASALVRAGQADAAERALLALRASSPEDPVINMELGRLAAGDGDVDTAVRFYHNALYAPWPSADGPRNVRRELIEFLLRQPEPRRAVPEIIAMTTDLPESAAAHVEVGRWFAAAGEPRRALEEYRRALRIDADAPAAREGAGLAAFAIGDYAAAVRYLPMTTASEEARRAARISTLVLTADPLAPRIGAAERSRRLRRGLEQAAARLRACATGASLVAPLESAPLADEADALLRRVRGRADLDVITDGLALIARIEAAVPPACAGGATPLDDALVRIARRLETEP